MLGTRSVSSSASSISPGVTPTPLNPRALASVTARVTASAAWPRIGGPKAAWKSMYSLPAPSQMRAP